MVSQVTWVRSQQNKKDIGLLKCWKFWRLYFSFYKSCTVLYTMILTWDFGEMGWKFMAQIDVFGLQAGKGRVVLVSSTVNLTRPPPTWEESLPRSGWLVDMSVGWLSWSLINLGKSSPLKEALFSRQRLLNNPRKAKASWEHTEQDVFILIALVCGCHASVVSSYLSFPTTTDYNLLS